MLTKNQSEYLYKYYRSKTNKSSRVFTRKELFQVVTYSTDISDGVIQIDKLIELSGDSNVRES